MPNDRQWKSDAVGYSAAHIWMRKHYSKTGRCEWCARTDRRTDYAQASDKMTRNRADWLELCRPCHTHFDGPQMKGKKHTPETRAKISAAMMGHYVSPETRVKLSKACGRTRVN